MCPIYWKYKYRLNLVMTGRFNETYLLKTYQKYKRDRYILS